VVTEREGVALDGAAAKSVLRRVADGAISANIRQLSHSNLSPRRV
jgi:hypothetical protein